MIKKREGFYFLIIAFSFLFISLSILEINAIDFLSPFYNGLVGVGVISNAQIYINSPLNTTYSFNSGEDYTLYLNVSSNFNLSSWRYSLNGAGYVFFTPNTTFNAAESSNELVVFANDTGGNVFNKSVVFFVSVNPGSVTGAPSGGGASSLPKFELDKDLIKVSIKQGETERQKLVIKNTGNTVLKISIDLKNLGRFVVLSENDFYLKSGESKTIYLDFFAVEQQKPDVYTGNIIITAGNIEKIVNVIVEVKEKKPTFDIKTDISDNKFVSGGEIEFDINIVNLGDLRNIDVLLYYSIMDFENTTLTFKEESLLIDKKLHIPGKIKLPYDIDYGNYIFYAKVSYGSIIATSSETFKVVSKEEMPRISKFIKNKYFILLILVIILIIFAIIILEYKRRKIRNKGRKSRTRGNIIKTG